MLFQNVFAIISDKKIYLHVIWSRFKTVYKYVSACVANTKIRNKLFASVKLIIIVFLRVDLRDRSDGNFGTNFACCEVFNIKAI